MVFKLGRRLALAGSSVLLGGLALAGGIHAANAQGDALIVNIAEAPATLDLAGGCGLPDISFPQSFYVQLTQYGKKPGPDGTTEYDPANIVPYFAKSWTISDDGTVYTFKLHEGAKFATGNPVDSAALKYSFERTLKVNGCGAYFLLDGFYTPPLISSIDTPDQYTVVINLAHPDPNALQLWAQPSGSIYDKEVIEDHGGTTAGSQNEWLSSHVTGGSGPFLLENYEPNKGAVMVANPDFFGEQPGSERIVINWINSDPTLLLQARNGEADVTLGLSLNSVKSLEGNSDLRIIANTTTMQQEIGMLNGKPPFDNVKVREAATLAIPYEQILDRVAFGYGALFYGPFMPGIPAYNEGLSGVRPFDLAKAKQLMKESGIQTPVDVEMVVREGFTIHDQIATIVQGTWRELGINVKIRRLSPSEYVDVTQGHKTQSYIRINGPGVIDAGYYLGYDMVCGIGFNLTEACIEEADKALVLARKEIDDGKRQALYDKITRLWNAASPKIPVYAVKLPTVLNKRVKEYHFVHETDLRFWSK